MTIQVYLESSLCEYSHSIELKMRWSLMLTQQHFRFNLFIASSVKIGYMRYVAVKSMLNKLLQ